MLLMDGDVSNKSSSCANAYGDLTYTNNKSTGGATTINLLLCDGQWHAQLDADSHNSTRRARALKSA